MDEALDRGLFRGGKHGGRAGDVAGLEPLRVGRVDDSGDMDDRVRAPRQPLETILIVERAVDPLDPLALALLAAGQGADLVPGRARLG